MAVIDKQASDFVISYGNKLRRSSFAELSKDLVMVGSEKEEIGVEIPTPEELLPYSFSLTRVLLKNGRVRILVKGTRPWLWGLSECGVHDAFDIFPNGKVQEIPRSDEDFCGRA